MLIDHLIITNKRPVCVGQIYQFISKLKGSGAFGFLFRQKHCVIFVH